MNGAPRRLGALALAAFAVASAAAACGDTDAQGQADAAEDVDRADGAVDAVGADGANPDADAADASGDARDAAATDTDDGDAEPPGPDCEADPGATLCPCATNSDCNSGYCIPSSRGDRICTTVCDAQCPLDLECKLVSFPGQDPTFLCVDGLVNLCRPCRANSDCQGAFGQVGDRCVDAGASAGAFCGVACGTGGTTCPAGTTCDEVPDIETGAVTSQCVPSEGECACSRRAILEAASTVCWNGGCAGARICTEEGLTACDARTPAAEVCDGVDNNCNGATDEGFPDSDGDGVADCVDPDTDGDGIPNDDDNCPTVANTAQDDRDEDGVGDACDPPPPPLPSHVEPGSPANDNGPTLHGMSETGLVVRVHAGPSCGGAPLTEALTEPDGAFAAGVWVPDDSTTTWSLAAWDPTFDLTSPCATPTLTYVEDSTPPPAPALNAASPASPSPDPSPIVSGTAEPGATVTLFADAACTAPLGVTTIAGAQGAFATPVTVAANAETALYATATDAAMNTSACSPALRYRHDDVPPTPPTLTATIPTSPSDSVTDPVLLGTTEAGATVTVYAAESCAGAPVATTVASPAGLFSVGVTVAPNSATAFTATATDAAGNTSTCSPAPRVYLHDDEDPAPPTLLGTTPPSPGATTTPTVYGTTEALATVRVHLGAGCTGFLIGAAEADDAGAFMVVVPVAANAETFLYARAVDLAGRTSACTAEPLRYRHDDTGPTPPVFTGTTPPSPSPAPQPTVHGLAEPLAAVSLHTDPSCVSAAFAATDADAAGAFSVAIDAADNATTTLWARATNAAGLLSACSPGSISYVHDDTPPPAPTLAGTTPDSPSSTLTPSVLGDAEPASRVAIFDDEACGGLPLGEADADATGAFSVPITVAPNGATSLFATATDAAGNVGPCSAAPLVYVHDGAEPLVPTLLATSPASPSRLTTTPTLIGQAEADTTVTIHLDPDCANAPIASTTATAGGQFTVAAAATPNAATTFYAAATSPSGVKSPCTPQGLTYVHDDVAPPPPNFTAPVPPSPTNTTTSPLLRGLAEAGSQVSVYTSPDCTSGWVGSVNVLSVGTFSLSADVAPDTTTTFYATATDAAGNASVCTPDGLSWTHDATAPAPPHLTATEPPAPAATTTPTVLGAAEPLSAVRLYTDALCAGSLAGQGAADAGGAFAITALVGANQTTALRATATDAAGNVSACSAAFEFINDSDAPLAPVWLGSTPPSPTAASTAPVLHGAAESGATVRLYIDAPCTGPPVATAPAAGDGTFSFNATVAANSVTRFYADALDGVGNASPCSQPELVYVHDTVAPPAPTVVATTPPSPSTQATPTVSGTAEAGTTVRVYLAAGCTGPIAATTTAGPGGGWAASAVGPVADNATTALHATATDAAGNVSPCSAGLPYTHDTTPPPAPLVTHTAPEPPSNVSRPRVVGTAEADALVRVYPNAGCTGTHRGVGYADGAGAFSVEAQASLNTTTTFYATAEDAAGNVGPCSSTSTAYLHDGVAPARPVMLATVPDRWSSVVSAPLVTGTAEALSTVQVFGAANCSGATLATTTATATGDFAATAEIGPGNAEARFAARARDAAGNLSQCSSSALDYRFDDTPPTFAGAVSAALGFETTSSGTMTWAPASDNFTPSNKIVYTICLSTRCGATDCDFDDPTSPLLYTTGPGATSRLISDLAPNTRYYAIVRASDEVGNQDANAAVVSFKTEGLNAATDLAMGENVACVTLANGAQTCWGPGTLPSSISDRVQIAIGPNHGCAVMRSGQVRCWNSNQFGQLGNGTTSSTSTTSSVVVSGIATAVKVGVGQFHSCALLGDGRVMCWGRDEHGQIGNGFAISADQLVPAAVTLGFDDPTPLTGAVDLAVGGNHACALRADGSAWCWGQNGSGQLGLGDTQQRWGAVASPVAGLVSVTAGQAHTCGLHADGRVSCWGWNAWGQVGDGGFPFDANAARDVGLEDVVAVRAGGLHTCAVRADGAAACWGQNTSGQAGTGAVANSQNTPHLLDLGAVAQIGAGNGYTCARTHDGRAFCFGDGQGGRLGQGASTASSLVPVEVVVPRGLSGVTSVSMHAAHACVGMSDGSARCWGRNVDGQLGGGEAGPDPGALTVVAPLPSAAPFARVATGARHSCALAADGRVSCWGANHAGQLGQAGVAAATTPTPVASLANVRALAVGADFACALTAAGAVWCWGDDSHGQLGRGTAGGSSPTPAEVPLGAVVEVTAGARHACARTQAGQVFCWGDDATGQVSGVASAPKASPSLVAGLDAVTGVAAGGGHSCARRVTGELQCWGDNAHGQLGRAMTGGVLPPAPVANVGDFVVLAAGARHTCGVRFTGDAYCWGDNSAGEIGINLGTASFDTPRAVVGLGVARGIAAGADRTCAHDRFGQAWCWGDNSDGALGDGGTDDAKAPRRVQCLP